MSIFFKKIGEVSYTELTSNNNVISNQNQYCGYEFKFTPSLPDNYCTVQIVEFPVSGKISVSKTSYSPESIFIYSEGDGGYIQAIEELGHYYLFEVESVFNSFYNRYGRYVIEFKEYTDEDVLYRSSVMYFEVKSLLNKVTFPFPGEGYEFDSNDGWATSNNTSLTKLNFGEGNRCLHCVSNDEFAIGDLAKISGIRIVSENEILYTAEEPNPLIEKNNYGIVVGVYEDSYIIDENSVITNVPIYLVGFEGQYIVPDFEFANPLIYYNNSNKELTADSADLYVAKWDSTTSVLLIENPISSLSSNINLSGSRGSLIKKGVSDWEEFKIGDAVNKVLMQTGEYDLDWKYVSALREVFVNSSLNTISIGKAVKMGGVYPFADIVAEHVEEDDTNDYTIETDDGSLEVESPVSEYIKQYHRIEGLFGLTSESILPTSTPQDGIHINNNQIYQMGEGISTSWMMYRYNDTDQKLGLHKITPELGTQITDVMYLGAINDVDEYKFISLSSDSGLLVVADNTTSKLIVKMVKRGAVYGATIVDEDFIDIDALCVSVHNIHSYKIGNTVYISFQYVLDDGGTVTTNIKAFTISSIDWDVPVASFISDYVDVLVTGISIATVNDWNDVLISSDVCGSEITYALAYDDGGMGQYLVTVVLRSDEINLDVSDVLDITNKLLYGSDLKITNLKSGLYVISYVDGDGYVEVVPMIMYNAMEGSFDIISDSTRYIPVQGEFDSADLTDLNLYDIIRVNDNQFAIFYQAPITGGTCLRSALGSILNNETIFWIETSDAVDSWVTGITLTNICSVFTTPINTTGRIVLSYILNNTASTANSVYNKTIDYVEGTVPVLGITEEEISCTPGENEGIVGLSGILTVPALNLIPGAIYYCDDNGNLTLTPTTLRMGTAINNSQLLKG